MKKILFSILVFFFLVGCTFQSSEQKTIDMDVNYKKGSSGLDFEFLSSVPDEVYMGEFVPLKLKLENEGAYDIKGGILNIAIETDYMGLIGNDIVEFELLGKSKEMPDGEYTVLMYNLQAKELEEQSVTHSTTTYVTACYEYQTEFSQDICMDLDIYNLEDEKICETDDVNLGSGQGAPLVVEKIETRMIYNPSENTIIPQFILNIRNKGEGNVIKSTSIDEACSSEEMSSEDMNIFELEISMSNEGQTSLLECIPENLKLRYKEIKVVCSGKNGFEAGKGNYLTPLYISLNYGYSLSKSKEITIKRIGW